MTWGQVIWGTNSPLISTSHPLQQNVRGPISQETSFGRNQEESLPSWFLPNGTSPWNIIPSHSEISPTPIDLLEATSNLVLLLDLAILIHSVSESSFSPRVILLLHLKCDLINNIKSATQLHMNHIKSFTTMIQFSSQPSLNV